MSFSSQIKINWNMQDNELAFKTKTNKLSSYEKTQRNFKFIFIYEINHCEKAVL